MKELQDNMFNKINAVIFLLSLLAFIATESLTFGTVAVASWLCSL
jgi:hypothetical protein